MAMKGFTPVPDHVFLDSSLPAAAKAIYALICVGSKGGNAVGLDWVSRAIGMSQESVLKYMRQLHGKGLLTAPTKGSRTRPAAVALEDPAQVLGSNLLQAVKQTLERARRRAPEGERGWRQEWLGEALMRAWLTALIESDDYTDDARPGFLVSPLSGQRLEFDRWYPGLALGFEFQGDQHIRSTALAPGKNIAHQRANDLMKVGLAFEHGARVVHIGPEDLTRHVIAGKVEGLAPVRPPSVIQLAAEHLEAESAGYRKRIAALRAGGPGHPA